MTWDTTQKVAPEPVLVFAVYLQDGNYFVLDGLKRSIIVSGEMQEWIRRVVVENIVKDVCRS